VVSLSTDEAVILRNLTLAYDGHPAVSQFSGSLARGSLTAIVGPNGAGKSTLLKGMVGLLRPAEGVIEYNQLKRRAIAYLPQHTEIDRRFPLSVIDTVAVRPLAADRLGTAGDARIAR
jgi:zinc/manganese transport system ATP-binding protein